MKKFTRGPRKAQRKLNALLDPFHKGVLLESPDFTHERQPDGRVKLSLSPAARKTLGIAP